MSKLPFAIFALFIILISGCALYSEPSFKVEYWQGGGTSGGYGESLHVIYTVKNGEITSFEGHYDVSWVAHSANEKSGSKYGECTLAEFMSENHSRCTPAKRILKLSDVPTLNGTVRMGGWGYAWNITILDNYSA